MHHENDEYVDDINITLDHSEKNAIYDIMRIFKERVKTSWGQDSMLFERLIRTPTPP